MPFDYNLLYDAALNYQKSCKATGKRRILQISCPPKAIFLKFNLFKVENSDL